MAYFWAAYRYPLKSMHLTDHSGRLKIIVGRNTKIRRKKKKYSEEVKEIKKLT